MSPNPYHIKFSKDFIILAICALTFIDVDSKLTVITNFDTPYPQRLHEERGNQDLPPPSDPATANASARLQICEEISHSGIFAAYGMNPIDAEGMYEELVIQSRYSNIVGTFYTPQLFSAYSNPFRLVPIEFDEYTIGATNIEIRTLRKKEYLFMCLLKRRKPDDSLESGEERSELHSSDLYYTAEKGSPTVDTEGNLHSESTSRENPLPMDGGSLIKNEPTDLIPLRVSKLYDAHRGLHAYRFLFFEEENDEQRSIVTIMLAAESAHVYQRPDFNVELHYIELRKHHLPAQNCQQDPVCRLNLENLWEYRTFRLCATVLRSLDDQVQYPRIIYRQTFWYSEQIFLRTGEAVARVAGKIYKEFVLPCYAATIDGEEKLFYISRAYNPYQAFVLTKDPVNDHFYLENLAINVSIVHERYNFGDVEI